MSDRWFKTSFTRQKVGLTLIFLGLVFFGAVFSLKFYQHQRERILSFSQVPALTQEAPKELFPTQISIPKVSIDLSVSGAKAEGEVWEISETGASYLLGSGIPGKPGNVVIYGHNKNRLFGPIRWLEKDALIEIENRQGEKFTYRVRETKIVSPENVEVLESTQDPILTLYTCTGLMDSKRYVVVAELLRR